MHFCKVLSGLNGTFANYWLTLNTDIWLVCNHRYDTWYNIYGVTDAMYIFFKVMFVFL